MMVDSRKELKEWMEEERRRKGLKQEEEKRIEIVDR